MKILKVLKEIPLKDDKGIEYVAIYYETDESFMGKTGGICSQCGYLKNNTECSIEPRLTYNKTGKEYQCSSSTFQGIETSVKDYTRYAVMTLKDYNNIRIQSLKKIPITVEMSKEELAIISTIL